MFILGNHQEVIQECEGCCRILERRKGSKSIRICSCCPYPKMEWIFGECNQSTHTNRNDLEDPIKEP